MTTHGYDMLTINPIKLSITFMNYSWRVNTSFGLLSNTIDPPPQSVQNIPGTRYSTFNLTMNGVISTIYICENRNFFTGNYFFEPLILPNT